MKKIIILIPVFNDWKSLDKLIEEIRIIANNHDDKFSIVVVNDGSTEKLGSNNQLFSQEIKVKILNLIQNVGHARSIAIGLKHIYEKEDFEFVIPMDGDGEDRPEEIGFFIENISYFNDKPIVGERVKRSEGYIFRFFYLIHKFVTFTFTGKSIKFGNFTCLPRDVVKKLVYEKSTWNSFSGALVKIQKNFGTIKSTRGKRYFGPSKMSFLNLIQHSLTIMSVFKANVFFRSVLFFFLYFFLISNKISFLTSIPLIGVFIFLLIILNLSKRENLEDYKNSLKNIRDIESN
tara:strand:+ start:1978 stop:2847 length:870 start_codon:yes stop_codon:yes gene_type:complete